MVLTSGTTAINPNVPDAASSSAQTHPESCRSSSASGDCRREAQHRRPPTTPAYYQGRPAWFWLEHFRRSGSRKEGFGDS
jgi:hypothetical protein